MGTKAFKNFIWVVWLLRPLDAIEPYRLEMGSKLQGGHGNSLYEYWNDKITTSLNQYGKEIGTQILVNCAQMNILMSLNLMYYH